MEEDKVEEVEDKVEEEVVEEEEEDKVEEEVKEEKVKGRIQLQMCCDGPLRQRGAAVHHKRSPNRGPPHHGQQASHSALYADPPQSHDLCWLLWQPVVARSPHSQLCLHT